MSHAQVSAAVSGLGWRFVLNGLMTLVPVGSLVEAAEVAGHAARISGELHIDLRPEAVVLTLPPPVTAETVTTAETITHELTGIGRVTVDGVSEGRQVQALEIAIDALDIPAIKPFWRAAMGYVDSPWEPVPDGALLDPLGQGPPIWFQQMDAPRPQRNRIHFDIWVPLDEAQSRMDRMVAAGGKLVRDEEAPDFWVFADPEGNEVCVCTAEGRG